ncbi:hypothetical protein VIGAN_03244600, partial [Vigna angularis var. angularis]
YSLIFVSARIIVFFFFSPLCLSGHNFFGHMSSKLKRLVSDLEEVKAWRGEKRFWRATKLVRERKSHPSLGVFEHHL